MKEYRCDGEHCGRRLALYDERFSVTIAITRHHQGQDFRHARYPGTIELDMCADCFQHFELAMQFKERPPLQHVKVPPPPAEPASGAVLWHDDAPNACCVCAAPATSYMATPDGGGLWACQAHYHEAQLLAAQPVAAPAHESPPRKVCFDCSELATHYLPTRDGGRVFLCEQHYAPLREKQSTAYDAFAARVKQHTGLILA